MFKVNDYVVYGNYGVCTIVDICTPPFEGINKDIKYYVLKTINSKGSTVYTPVTNGNAVMRNILTKKEAMELIHRIPDMGTIILENDKYREAHYRKSILSGDIEELIIIIKTLTLRREERLAAGKKMSNTDEKYLQQAEESLFGELSLSFGLTVDEVKEFFIQQVKELERI